MTETFRRKPEPGTAGEITVGRYLTGNLGQVDEIARLAGVSGFTRAEVDLPGLGIVLLFRWVSSHDQGVREEFEVIRAGDYLATGLVLDLFVMTDTSIGQWYEPVPR